MFIRIRNDGKKAGIYGQLSFSIKIMKELSPFLYNVNLYFQGEPMLHPLFFTFLENCTVPEIVVSTNGHFLDRRECGKDCKVASK